MDYQIFQQINGLAGRWEWLDAIGIFLACYFQYFVGGTLLLFLFTKNKSQRLKNEWMIFLAFAAAVIARLGVAEIIHRAFFRPRPFVAHQITQLIPYAAEKSAFPSGHATFFFALSAVIFLFNKKAGYWFFGASLLISVGRIFVGVHYFSDLIGGAIIGAFVGWGAVRIFKKTRYAKSVEI